MSTQTGPQTKDQGPGTTLRALFCLTVIFATLLTALLQCAGCATSGGPVLPKPIPVQLEEAK